jgi:hypothetical protein
MDFCKIMLTFLEATKNSCHYFVKKLRYSLL